MGFCKIKLQLNLRELKLDINLIGGFFMKLKKIKRLLVVTFCLSLLLSTMQVNASGDCGDISTKVDDNPKIEALLHAGYCEGTIEGLEQSDIDNIYNAIIEGRDVQVTNSYMEIDNFSEIENFFSYDESELLNMGMSKTDIEATQQYFEDLLAKSDAEISSSCGVDLTEVKMLRKTIENAEANKLKKSGDNKEITNKVTASGSISTSKLQLTQSVTNNSSSTPNYGVVVSYKWITPYSLCVAKDCIVIGWGGELNSRGESGTMNYYGWTSATEWADYVTAVTNPLTEETTNAGMEYYFPQSEGKDWQGHMAKTKTGSARITIYQTLAEGKDTKVISHYCHRTVAVTGVDITVSNTGASVSISIGAAYDKSPQQRTTIAY